jgi:hypothetical protein
MAYIAHGAGQNASFPSVWQDVKYPKDIVINGILFDIDTFTPKIGSRVMNWTGNFGTGAAKTWTSYDDDDIYYFGIWHNDNAAAQTAGTIFAPNYPMVSRAITSDYVNNNADGPTMMRNATHCNTSLWHRDWLDHPLKTWHYNYTIDEYLGMWPYAHTNGSRVHYDGSNGKMCYMDGTYRTIGAEIGYNIIDPETSSGMLFRQIHSDNTKTCQQLAVINYTSDANLRSTTKTELYGTTSTSSYIHHLTKCNNGDHFFLTHEGSTSLGGNNMNADIIRYVNSTNTITEEYTNFANAQYYYYPFCGPSNVVYHQESGESTTSKKICYYYQFGTATFDWNLYNRVWFIEMDIDAATITRTLCTHTHPAVANADDDIADARVSAAISLFGPEYIVESRIISASQAIDSQKYLLVGILNNGTYSKAHDRPYMMMKIDASDATNLTAVTGSGTYGKWNDILTTSPNLVNDYDAAPWCIAPLNTEHTIMMVFTKHSTHVLKFDTSTETMSEVWYDHYTVFQQVMWMPSGKVLTAEWEKDFAVGTAVVDQHAPTPLQVWAEDLVYNVSVTTDSDYVTYAGSDITNTLSISAQDATDSNVETDLTLQIVGPALFDNSTKTKTVTTSKTADVTETLTINDNGHIEVKVVEIQSQ